MMNNNYFKRKNIILLIIVAIVIASPYILDIYFVHLTTGIFIYATLSIGLGVLTKTGQVSIGQAAFFGLGAYTAAVVNKFIGPFPFLEFIMAVLVSLVIAIFLGYITLRLKGIYFSIATLAFAETLLVLAMMERRFIGGATGIAVPPLFKNNPIINYYFGFFLVAIAFLISYIANRTKLGFASTVIKNDERLAISIGINPTRYKISAFAISAIISGLAGAFYVHYITFIVPNEVFSLTISVAILAMVIFGGAYSLTGPLIGAIVLRILEEMLRLNINYGHMIGYGVILIIGILFMPAGVVGIWEKLSRKKPPARKLLVLGMGKKNR